MADQELYPLQIQHQLVPRIWGGQRLPELFGAGDAAVVNPSEPSQPIGEAWLVYEQNVVLNGIWAGQSLASVTQQLGPQLIGTRSFAHYGVDFPLLIKFLDVNQNISIQVHPDDAYAHTREADSGFHGKTEAWYILDTRPGATIIHGLLEATTPRIFADALANDACETMLRFVGVRKDDTILVPAGTIHAINAGVLLYEVQQKSDLTYRVYDYGRQDTKTGQPRELHIDKALDVIDFSRATFMPQDPYPIEPDGSRVRLTTCPFFTLERWNLTAARGVAWEVNPATLEILTVIEGSVTLEWGGGSLPLAYGASVVLPAQLGACHLASPAPARVLRVFIPG
ncbi:MAG: mannose-6-phosphate isomerase [Chloroflexaceae bacterium]|nr:mannose-6-phosphate isomerase [Chloroflexaceae bacterium]